MKESTQEFRQQQSTPLQRSRIATLIKSADRIEKHPYDGSESKHVLVFDEETADEERITILAHSYNEISEMLHIAWAKQYERDLARESAQ